MASDPRGIIKNICKELYDSAFLDDFVMMALDLTDRSFFGKLFPYAIAYRACHLFMVSGGEDDSGGSGAIGMGRIASMSEGGLSVSFEQSGSLRVCLVFPNHDQN
jgi:hypothetical protein